VSVRAILLVAWFIPSIPVCFFRPFYGIVLWTIVAFTSPQWYTWGAANLLPWAQLIAMPTMAGFLVYHRNDLHRLASRESVLMMLLWAWFTITTLVTTNIPVFAHHAVQTWDLWVIVSKIFVMVFLTIGIVNSFDRLRILVITIASCFGIFVAKSLPFLIMSGGGERVYGPERSMIADNNDFGLALNMTLPMFFFLAQSETKPWLKRLFGALFLMAIPAIFFTYSRGAVVGLIAVLGLMILKTRQRIILVPVAFLALAGAILFAPQSWKDRMNPSKDTMMDKSARGRINAWWFAVHLVEDYPITGGGFRTFTGPLFLLYAPDPQDFHYAHSVYFGILGEHGVPGLLLFATLIASAFLSLRQVVKWGRMYGDPLPGHYANMFYYSLIGFLISGLFLGRAYFDYAYTVLACTAILKKTCLERWAAQAAEEESATQPEEQLA
jgi:probable O-glycosylation ligase (exosortase A-associated)